MQTDRKRAVACAWLLTFVWSLWGVGGRMVAADTVPPTLLSVEPASQTMDVPVDAPIRFAFSEPMSDVPARLDVRFVVAGLGGGALRGWRPVWNPDDRVLTCEPVTPWPAASVISWLVGTNMVDVAANSLAQVYTGAFRTAVPDGGGWPTNQATVFALERADLYRQTTPDQVERQPAAGYQFQASAQMGTNRAPDLVQLRLPAGSLVRLEQDLLDRARYVYGATASDGSAFDPLYPEGVYHFEVSEGGLIQDVFGILSGPPPTPPRLLNYDAAQRVVPNLAFRVEWDPWTDGTADDVVELAVEGTVVHSPAPDEPGALDGTATSWVIPVSALQPSNHYTGTLTWTRSSVTTNAAQAYGMQTRRLTSTRFSLVTVGPDEVGAPEFFGVELSPNQALRFRIAADPGSHVTVEHSPNLQPGSWQVWMTTNTVAGEFEVSLPAVEAQEYFRARSP